MTETLKNILIEMQNAFLPSQAKGINIAVQIIVEEEKWGFLIKDETCELIEGNVDSPTYTLETDFYTIEDIVSGNLKATAAYMRGNVRFTGDIFKAMKLSDLFSLSKDDLTY